MDLHLYLYLIWDKLWRNRDDINLPNASLKNYHILRFGVFWDPRAIFGQAIDTRRIDWSWCCWGLPKI